MAKKPKWELNFQPVSVRMADGSALNGMVNIRDFPRLSDFFRDCEDQFIVVVEDQDDPPRVVIVNKTYIIWAVAFPKVGK